MAGVDTDYLGKPLSNPPDLGAVQYGFILGDINSDKHVTLADAIVGVQLLSGLAPETAADVDGSAKIDMAEILFILEQLK